MRIQGFLCLASAALVTAWLPGDHKNVTAIDGANLFVATPSWTYDSSHSVTGRKATKRWLPASGKIRGVNLGSMFVFEPWIAENEWNNMGCGPYKSEFDCVSGLGQAAANAAFQNHWNTWITQGDIAQMQGYGLNTIRVPVGYWMREDIVYSDSEHFPQGGLAYLERLCGWASDAGFYIIIDLHGAPGAQWAENADTGQVRYVSLICNFSNDDFKVRPVSRILRRLPIRASPQIPRMDGQNHPHQLQLPQRRHARDRQRARREPK